MQRDRFCSVRRSWAAASLQSASAASLGRCRRVRWRQAPTAVSVTLTAVRFYDARHGDAVGHGGTVLTTADGGETWARRLDGRRIALLALAAPKGRGDEPALRNAERLVTHGPDKPLLDVLMLDPLHAVAVGAYGLAFATADGADLDRMDGPPRQH